MQDSQFTGPISSHPLYQVHREMLYRCEKPTHRDYKYYGARGIRVCESWRSARVFIAYVETELGPREPGMTLDRIDRDRGYEPGNLRWATRTEQTMNRSCTVRVRHEGSEVLLGDLCRRHGKDFNRVWHRIKILGWTVHDALHRPTRQYPRRA